MAVAASKQLEDHEERLAHLEQVTLIGNGSRSLREQVRTHEAWITENKKPINDAIIEVAAHGRWIGNFNRVGWVVITILLGIFLEFGCAASLGVMLLLNQFGFLPKP